MLNGAYHCEEKGGRHYFARFFSEHRVVVAVVETRDPFDALIRNVLGWLDERRDEVTTYTEDHSALSFVVDYSSMFAGGKPVEYQGALVDERTVVLNGRSYTLVEWPELIDLNVADEATLRLLPGMSAARAQTLLEFRASSSIDSLEDLERIYGFGPTLIGDLTPWVTVT